MAHACVYWYLCTLVCHRILVCRMRVWVPHACVPVSVYFGERDAKRHATGGVFGENLERDASVTTGGGG